MDNDKIFQKTLTTFILDLFLGILIGITFVTAICNAFDTFGNSIIFKIILIVCIIGIGTSGIFCIIYKKIKCNPVHQSYIWFIFQMVLKCIGVIDLYMWAKHDIDRVEYVFFIIIAYIFFSTFTKADQINTEKNEKEEYNQLKKKLQYYMDYSFVMDVNNYAKTAENIKKYKYLRENYWKTKGKNIQINDIDLTAEMLTNESASDYINYALEAQIENMLDGD